MQKPSMFYGASPHIFEKARELRKKMTEAEQILWKRLKRKQLYGFKFRRQHPISEFVADFYCHAAKLVVEVEVDGGFHNLKDQKAYDHKRNKLMNKFGITILRFTNEQIENNIDSVIVEIKIFFKVNDVR